MTTEAPADELRAADVRVHFGGIKAVDGVTLTLHRGEILGLIGPNGAGKTTLVNAITGFAPLTSGRVAIGGRDVTGMPTFGLARLGLARTFQTGRLFRSFTVRENVEVAAVASGSDRRAARRRAGEILRLMQLEELAGLAAADLPLGTERRLEVARALGGAPTFLFLDEPAAGLNDAEGRHLVRTIEEWSERSRCGVLIIEHDMQVIMRLCHRIQVVNEGKTISLGTPQEIRRDPRVIEAYLGTGAQEA